METTERKIHWEKIYRTKDPTEVSWHQDEPVTSLDFIRQLNLPKTARIFDNGAGDSLLVDNLLKLGFENITVLDISEAALNRVKLRLGKKAANIKWIIADEAFCDPCEQFALWHDRAAFHFLTDQKEIASYVRTIENCITPGGFLIMGTFSDKGPKKCSGLEVKRYSETLLNDLLKDSFDKVKCITVDHITPFDTTQNFLFCVFRRKKN
jgi:2-polyprenyl-3-methyl-5-hydroxy-6-metoxy-1,4-benzoquinol methylase